VSDLKDGIAMHACDDRAAVDEVKQYLSDEAWEAVSEMMASINTLTWCRSLQKVQAHRVAKGHRAGFDVDVTPRTGGPVGRMLSIRWPCVTHSVQ